MTKEREPEKKVGIIKAVCVCGGRSYPPPPKGARVDAVADRDETFSLSFSKALPWKTKENAVVPTYPKPGLIPRAMQEK